MTRFLNLSFVFIGTVTCFTLPEVTIAGGGLRVVAVTGQAAAGTGTGVKFGSFSPPVINDRGETAFDATLSGTGVTGANTTGVWSEGGGNGLQLLARQG
jgi:hypothetical protein